MSKKKKRSVVPVYLRKFETSNFEISLPSLTSLLYGIPLSYYRRQSPWGAASTASPCTRVPQCPSWLIRTRVKAICMSARACSSSKFHAMPPLDTASLSVLRPCAYFICAADGLDPLKLAHPYQSESGFDPGVIFPPSPAHANENGSTQLPFPSFDATREASKSTQTLLHGLEI